MTDARACDDIATTAFGAAADLLGALIDAGLAASTGRDAARVAADFRRMGDTARQAATDLERLLERRGALREAVA